jgi:twitching motility protein PilT
MNFAIQLLQHLAAKSEFQEIILVAGMPATLRTRAEFVPVGGARLTPEDVRETLTVWMSHASPSPGGLFREGAFSFGAKDLGRFRVSYITQRGSYVARLKKISVDIPDLSTLLDPETARDAESLVLNAHRGLLVVNGPSSEANNLLVYSLLKKVNEKVQRLIHIIEDGLSFLLRHDRSLIVQTEIGSDMPNLEDALESMICLSADILYVRDVYRRDDLLVALRAASVTVFTIVTTSVLDVERLIAEGKVDFDPSLMRGIWRVQEADGGRIQLSIGSGRL